MVQYRIGEKVSWNWGDGVGEGKITERFTEKVSCQIDGQEVTRNATNDEPAYMIEQEDGDRVLKSATELK